VKSPRLMAWAIARPYISLTLGLQSMELKSNFKKSVKRSGPVNKNLEETNIRMKSSQEISHVNVEVVSTISETVSASTVRCWCDDEWRIRLQIHTQSWHSYHLGTRADGRQLCVQTGVRVQPLGATPHCSLLKVVRPE
jgi:hypothetical protein